jgi:carboxymethylenebutenolidase
MHRVAPFRSSFDSGGKAISLDGFVPQGDARRFPAVIGLHGSGGSYASMAEPAVHLAAQGFAVYIPHYFERTGSTQITDKASMVRHFPLWGKALWDAVGHVQGQRHVEPRKIGLVGFSLGAYLALSVASVDPRIQAVVDFFGGFPKEMKFFMRRLCPTLILHGEADPTVPVQEAHRLQRMLENRGIPHEMHIYPGVGHGFEGETCRDADRRTLAFLRKYLTNPGT